MKKYFRKIVKNGAGTYSVSIPKEIIKELDLCERQEVSVRKIFGKIMIDVK